MENDSQSKAVSSTDSVIPAEYIAYVEANIKVPEKQIDLMNSDGSLNFDLFMKMYRTALMWNDQGFMARKAELT